LEKIRIYIFGVLAVDTVVQWDIVIICFDIVVHFGFVDIFNIKIAFVVVFEPNLQGLDVLKFISVHL
jgi:hypothetical protein